MGGKSRREWQRQGGGGWNDGICGRSGMGKLGLAGVAEQHYRSELGWLGRVWSGRGLLGMASIFMVEWWYFLQELRGYDGEWVAIFLVACLVCRSSF